MSPPLAHHQPSTSELLFIRQSHQTSAENTKSFTCVNFTRNVFVRGAAYFQAISIVSRRFGYPDTFRLADAGRCRIHYLQPTNRAQYEQRDRQHQRANHDDLLRSIPGQSWNKTAPKSTETFTVNTFDCVLATYCWQRSWRSDHLALSHTPPPTYTPSRQQHVHTRNKYIVKSCSTANHQRSFQPTTKKK